MHKTLIILLFFTCFFISPVYPDIESLIDEMTIEEKVGQLFMIGNLEKKYKPEELFGKYHFGNIFLGYTDINELAPEEVGHLTNNLQASAEKHNHGVPLLIATDQEGGKVNRFKKGAVIFPSQNYVGSRVSLSTAKEIARCTAQQLRAIGVNVNFSPVTDVNTNNKSHIAVLKRSFGDNPEKVSEYVIEYMKGYSEEGLIGCMKHFPGYGDVSPDPHKSLPVTYKTYSQLKKCELIPYINSLKKTKVDMIMTAHIWVPEISGKKAIPATMSDKILDGILRKDLGYDYVIITDDFNMSGIPKEDGIGKLVLQCINADVDIILFVGAGKLQKTAWEAVRRAVKNGRITKERLDKSVKRILALKYKYDLFNKRYIDLNKIKYSVNTKRQRDLLNKLNQERIGK